MRNIEAFVQMNSSSDKGSTIIGTARHEGRLDPSRSYRNGWNNWSPVSEGVRIWKVGA